MGLTNEAINSGSIYMSPSHNSLAQIYFHPDFTKAVASVRGDVRVVVIQFPDGKLLTCLRFSKKSNAMIVSGIVECRTIELKN